MDVLRNETIARVRSCLISTKGQISLKQLEDDYRTLLGERIPYQKLGYKSLESFLLSEPSIVTTKHPSGQVFVDAKTSDSTAHISSMIRKQKTDKKKTVRIMPRRFNQRYYTQPPPTTDKWRPKRPVAPSNTRNFSNFSPKLTAVSHNQFVNSPKKPKVASRIVAPSNFVPFQDLKNHSTAEKENVPKVRESKESSAMPPEDIDKVCSPFTSAMKRIARVMNELDLERDSGNSSPTADYTVQSHNHKPPAPVIPEFVKTGDAIQDLRNFIDIYKLGPIEIKFTQTKPKNSKTALCHCKIKVDQHTFSSYPADFYNNETAEKHASQKALDDLIQRYGRRKSLLISSNDDIISRIPPMLEKHQNAVWMWQIKDDYEDKYKEQLPSDWLQVIDSSPEVSIEKCPGGTVLKHCNPDDVLQKGKKLDISLNLSDVSIPCNTIQFSENNRLYALVTAAVSCNEIWCQQCNTGEYAHFVAMTEKMENFYQNYKDEHIPKNITFGSCYVIYRDSNWHRVRALSIPKDGFVDVFLVDYGAEVHVPVSDVYSLKRQFAVEQAQAFVCRLDGLDDLYDASVDSEHVQNLVGREFIIEMVEDNGENRELTIPVVLYDVTNHSSINQELISAITIDSAVPVLEKGVITEVYVSNIESNGDVYVQVRSPGYSNLQELLRQVETTIKQDSPTYLLSPITRENSKDVIYLMQCKTTKRWLRATIIDWSPKGDLAQIYFVDYGNTDVVNVRNEIMYPLAKLDDLASQYPPQATKVRIMIEKIPEEFVEKASKLMPKENVILLKILSYDNENVAWVEFFKRSSDGGLFCINKSISVEAELKSVDVNSNNSRKRLINLAQFNDGTKNVPSGGSLNKPTLPKKGDYFNVNIPFAVNPWNFFVQPLETLDELTAIMADMQEFYKDVQFSPLPISEIIPGQIYASKHEDGLWYRTSVLKVIHSGSISVFYCDFGYYTNLTLDQLVPLEAKYLNFPYQALKAKLSGIRPVKNKWTMEDCDVFNSLVTKRQFVSILVNIEKDELYKSDIILQLLLIDTSSDEDVNIKNVLVERGIATSVN